MIYERPQQSPYYDRFFFSYDIRPQLSLQLAYNDTNFHEFRGEIPRFIGYQRANSSDTTRFSTLHTYDGWQMKLQCDSTYITYVCDSDTITIQVEGFLKSVPDTVRNGELSLNLVVDWSNLLKERNGQIYVKPQGLNFTER